MELLEKKLRAELEGEVYFDPVTCSVYSVDASIFEIKPLGIAIPKTKHDLKAALQICQEFNIPITVRGAATGITGGCLGHGLILDLSKYLTKVISLDLDQKTVVCEPGLIQDDLNKLLDPLGYCLGPDTSTGNRATIGGMLANNAAGARSLRHGKMVDHVEEVELLLPTGETILFGPVSKSEWDLKSSEENREGHIYRTLGQIKEKNADEIRRRFPSIPRRVSGYNLDELLKTAPLNVSKLIAGSEGSLGIAAEIKMKIVPKLGRTGLLLFFFHEMLDAFRSVPELLQFNPLSLEMVDDQIISLGRESPSMRGRIRWLEGDPGAILILEVEEDASENIEDKLKKIANDLQHIGYARISVLHPHQMKDVMDLRKSGLGILLSKRSYSRAIAFLEDISIPPSKLASFMEAFLAYLSSKGKKAGIYGHVGAGCMHVRPYMNLQEPNELKLMREMMEEVSTMLLKAGGALSGEHGDGWIRSWLNPKMFGETLVEAFKKIKHAFDPLNLMNPGKIIPDSKEWEDLRSNGRPIDPVTFLDFSKEGGFALAADLCNGNGQCRKSEGVMCPSYQATRSEFHSTRARAQALRSIIHQRLPFKDLTGEGLYAVMDLCLSCKGCKKECPSQVDMAKFKSEFLYHYQEKNGISFRNRLFGNIGRIQSWMAPFARLINPLMRWKLVKKGLGRIGISTRRPLPSISPQIFSSWFSTYQQPVNLSQTIVLFNDTFTEFNHPEVGKAAVRLFNALGFLVVLSTWHCCGRPAFSKGLLPAAKHQARLLARHTRQFIDKGYPIIGLEPSCLLSIRDDYPGLFTMEDVDRENVNRLISSSYLLDEFLVKLVEEGRFPFSLFKEEDKKIKVHGHCYQKAIIGMESTLKLLRAFPGFQVEEIPSGCCGMAGSFGYEAEHEEISMKIGELVLFPSIRSGDEEEWVIANGTSCRQQIFDGTSRKALHLAEALLSRMI